MSPSPYQLHRAYLSSDLGLRDLLSILHSGGWSEDDVRREIPDPEIQAAYSRYLLDKRAWKQITDDGATVVAHVKWAGRK